MKFTDKTQAQRINLKVGDYFLNRDNDVRQLVEIDSHLRVLDVVKGQTSVDSKYTSVSDFIDRFTKYNGKITKIHISEIIFVKSNEAAGN